MNPHDNREQNGLDGITEAREGGNPSHPQDVMDEGPRQEIGAAEKSNKGSHTQAEDNGVEASRGSVFFHCYFG